MHSFRTYLYAFALTWSSLLPARLAAQETQGMALAEKDSIQLFRGLSATYNLAGTVMRMVSDYGDLEGGLRANLRDKYFPTFELGLGSAKHSSDPVTGVAAKTLSPFFRIGCDYNVSRNKHDIYRVLFGARYAFTYFRQEAYADIEDPYWGGISHYESKTSCNYHWAELVFAVDAKMWGPLRLGWSFRYKRKLAGSSKADGQKLWYIPGFGKNGNKLGGTFNIVLELGRKNKKTSKEQE